ncbi:MAG: response regulator transcription factor [Oscillospiraceae bacterium]|nr:response regulator transcription factor [Oscillospiraceae bacterium]
MADKILIVEDELQLARFVELELSHEGYIVGKAGDGRTGLEMAESGEYDLVLLDIMLPELNGLEVLRRLRRSSDIPVIMLTARDAVMDKVSGLDMGANDYMTKPFAIEELLARIRAVLRQTETKAAAPEAAPAGDVLTVNGVTVDTARHTVTCNDTPIELTNREFTLLVSLMENRSIVMSRDVLLEKVWGYDYMGETNVVDVYIRYLRSKIDDVFGIHLITTVRGVGYVIK